MTDIEAILNAYPATLDHVDHDAFIIFVDECRNCARACVACADPCLAESDRADLARCIGATLTCGDLATTTVATVTRQTSFDAAVVRAVLQACMEACRARYDECRKHALTHEHCRVCGEACTRCAHVCRDLLASVR